MPPFAMRSFLSSVATICLALAGAISGQQSSSSSSWSVANSDGSASVLPDLSQYGYSHSWTSDGGWFLDPDSASGSDAQYPGISFGGVNTVQRCADLCSSSSKTGVDYPGGSWNSASGTCYCERRLVCREPCLGQAETPGITFARRPASFYRRCERSYCEYFSSSSQGQGGGAEDWCKSVGFNYETCLQKTGRIPRYNEIDGLPNLVPYGYAHVWRADDGWFINPNLSLQQNGPLDGDNRLDGDDAGGRYRGAVFENVESVHRCAELCYNSDADHPGGAWNAGNGGCFCEEKLVCLEPCLGRGNDDAVSGYAFSRVPRSNFEMCAKSYCEYFEEDNAEWCKEVGFDYDRCLYETGRSPLPNLSKYGYPHSWSAEGGWFFNPHYDSEYHGNVTTFEDVDGPYECAHLCSTQSTRHPTGSWNSATKVCYCDEMGQSKCLEPCVGQRGELPGIVFASRRKSSFPRCEKSFCEYFEDEWCDEIGFDLEECWVRRGGASPLESGGTPGSFGLSSRSVATGSPSHSICLVLSAFASAFALGLLII